MHDKYDRADQAAQQNRRYTANKAPRKAPSRILTATVAAIQEVEDTFGFLWGHPKPGIELTDAQRQWLDVWLECRNRILTRGNDQVRAAENDLNSQSFNKDSR